MSTSHNQARKIKSELRVKPKWARSWKLFNYNIATDRICGDSARLIYASGALVFDNSLHK